jgi:hypothetical protein
MAEKIANMGMLKPPQSVVGFLEEFDREYYRSDKPERRLSLFNGIPDFTRGEAVLSDSIVDSKTLSDDDKAIIFSIRVDFPDGLPKHAPGDSKIILKIFVDDMQSPKVSIKMINLVRNPNEGSLYLRVETGQNVRVILVDPEHAWVDSTPKLGVFLILR